MALARIEGLTTVSQRQFVWLQPLSITKVRLRADLRSVALGGRAINSDKSSDSEAPSSAGPCSLPNMAIPTAYLTTAKNLRPILEDMQKAGVPRRVTYEFLKQLGHGSSANRPVIAVMKALRFLTESGEPTDRYRRFKDPGQAGAVLAEALRDAYSDVFTVDEQANERTTNELKGIFARLSDKGDSVNMKMATTFKTLADIADFSAGAAAASGNGAGPEPEPDLEPDPGHTPELPLKDLERGVVVHHDVHIHLPVTTDIAVYDAIFRSLRANLR